jgi:hypothetical protein
VTVYADNPAGRLHKLLTAFRNAEGSRDSFARILRVSAYSGDALIRSFAQVFVLPDDILNEIRQVDESNYDPDLALRWQDSMADVISTTIFFGEKNPDSPTFSDFMSSLEYCSYVLHRNRPGHKPAESDMDKLKELISELLAQLKDDDSSIDTDLKAFLLSRTEEMARAVNKFEIRGLAGLEEAFDKTIGALNRRPDLTARGKDDSGVWKKFAALLVTVAAVLQISTSSFMLPGQIRQAIEGTQPTPVVVVAPKSQTGTDATRTTPPTNARDKHTDGKLSDDTSLGDKH